MGRKLFTYPILLLSLLLLLSACGGKEQDASAEDKTGGEETAETGAEEGTENEEADEAGGDATFTALENMEPAAVTEGDFEVVEFETSPSPKNYYHSNADNGLLIMEDNDRFVFLDYLNGEEAPLSTSIENFEEDAADGSFFHSNAMYTEVWDDKYYFTGSIPVGENEYDREYALLELDMETREIREILLEEGFLTLVKDENVLFVGTEERIYAVDLETNEVLWENDGGISSGWYPQFSVTDNSLVFSSWEILEVYSKETGELIYEDTGFFYDVETDGDMFYGLVNAADYGEGEVQIVSFHETDGFQEELTEIVEVDHVYSEDDVTLDLVNGRLFAKMENGILAYDADTYEHLWTAAYGTIEDRDAEGGNYTYTMYNVYTDDYIYTYTDGLPSPSEDAMHLFSVIDAATGEVLEHYNFGSYAAAGPFLDETNGKIMMYYHDGDQANAYMLEME
jgi:outer membrane protein assembly factor BamB